MAPPLDFPGGTAVAVLAAVAIIWVLSSLSKAEFGALAVTVAVASAIYAWARWRAAARGPAPGALPD